MGRIGGLPERDILVRMLGDPEWWVRYRAARALVAGSFGTRAEIADQASRLGDRFARDIVAQALAGEPLTGHGLIAAAQWIFLAISSA
jgi:hypothetical protein